MTLRYRINSPDVTAESFDEEVLVIHLRKGHYYSLRQSAIPIWGLLAEGWDAGEIARILAATEAGREGEIQVAVADFVRVLEAEGLIAAEPDRPPAEGVPGAGVPAGAFSPPLFDRYDDMQDLLRLDPIHEVDPSGWPSQPKDREA